MENKCPVCEKKMSCSEVDPRVSWCNVCCEIWETWEMELARDNPEEFAKWIGKEGEV